MKILVIGGIHGNETLGLELVKLIKSKPVKNVSTLLANKKAIAMNCRFINQDLNRSFPGDIISKDYEQQRAAQLLKIVPNYDVVLDFHNTSCQNNNCCFVGENANENLFNIAGFINMKRVIVADYECLNKYSNNCLSIEVSIDNKLNNLEYWYKKICELSILSDYNVVSIIQKYRFVYRITNEDRDKFKLNEKKLIPFKKISNSLAKKIGVVSPAYPIFIADKYTPYNFGGILNKL